MGKKIAVATILVAMVYGYSKLDQVGVFDFVESVFVTVFSFFEGMGA